MSQKHHVMHGRDHLPDGADPIPGLHAGFGHDTIDQVITGLSPSGFWKLNESSGLVAYDSSGNGLDLTDDYTHPPLWGQAAGPPGEQTADFENGAFSDWARVARTWAPMTSDFTAGIWVKRNSTADTTVMGRGDPGRSGGVGWQLWVTGGSTIPANKPALYIAPFGSVFADNALAVGTWAFLAAVYTGGNTWKLYVNGLLQTAGTLTGSYTPGIAGLPLWIGHDGSIGGAVQGAAFTGSYAFLTPTALTSTELVSIYDSATVDHLARLGEAYIANGSGGAMWAFPLEVTF